MVPHLITALRGPINELEQRILDTTPAIERWFRLEWMEHTPPFYCAVDVRNAGFKLAPVDTNLFPTGWNNLTPAMLPLAVQAAMAAIEKICPEARNLLVVPDVPTHNTFYLANLLQLKTIFHQAGLNVRFGSLDAAVKQPTELHLPTGETITLEPLIRTKNRLGVKGFDPCTILLNNPLAAGVPGILEDVSTQFLLPPPHISAAVRHKLKHLQCYEEVAKRFGKLVGVDPWLINPMFAPYAEVDFASNASRDALASEVDAMLNKIRRKYKEYGINEKPFVVIKADGGVEGAGGMGIMTVREVKDLSTLGEKSKRSSPKAAGSSKTRAEPPISKLILQEGVQTNERVNAAVAEPVVYMIDRYVVGGFYRIHAERGTDENLNAPGSSYVPLAFADSGRLPQPGEKPGSSSPNRFYMYGVIARLAMLAASYEIEATDPEAEVYE
jgi:glutamate--cysteine ligase